jgi:hypothetical protein
MKIEQVKKGMKIYNNGDMANQEHWGTVTRIIPGGRFEAQIQITPDDPELIEQGIVNPYVISACEIQEIDKGNGSTRIVTEKARRTFRKQQMDILRAALSRKPVLA